MESAAHVPALTVIPDPVSPPEPPLLHRKIAKLPKHFRDVINSMLDDSAPAREIIRKLNEITDPPLPYANPT